MQVVAIDPRGEPRLEARAPLTPGPGELLLGLRWSGLCGTDLFKLRPGGVAPGSVLGHEIVGDVVAVGAEVRGFAPGDRVVVPHHVPCGSCRLCLAGAPTQCAAFLENQLAPGGFSEQILVRRRAVEAAARRIPGPIGDDDAVFLEPAACVLRGIDRSGLVAAAAASGEGVTAVLGGGSMGLLHLLLLRALPVRLRVVVSDPLPERRERALALGADAAVEPGEALVGALRESVSEGADAVFDCVGGGRIAAEALAALRPGGTAVLFAHAEPGEPPRFALNDLFKSEKRLIGTYSGTPAEQERVFAMLLAGSFRPSALVTHRLPLARFAEGVELARRQLALKVLFHP